MRNTTREMTMPALAGVPDSLTVGMYTIAVVLGSGNFVAVRFSNRELAPFWGAGLRFGLAALVFLAIVRWQRLSWPRGRDLALAVAFGVLSFAGFYALMYWALVRVEAGAATVVLAVVPLATALLAAAQRLERLRPRTALGAMAAGAGILWMAVGPDGLVVPAAALVALLGASLVSAQGVIVGKRVSGFHPAVTNAVGMLTGSVLLLVFSAVAGEPWVLPTSGEVVAAVAYLVMFGSVGLFALVLLVVRRWTASATSYLFVLFPVVTMLIDAWLTGAPITGRGLTGAALVMLGVWFGALSPGARRAGRVQPESGTRVATGPAREEASGRDLDAGQRGGAHPHKGLASVGATDGRSPEPRPEPAPASR